VLDVGCGSGAYLLTLADLVGSRGSVEALDLAPENVAAVEDRRRSWQSACPLHVRLGSVLALPYAASQFDAVWFSNTLQYLAGDALHQAFAELRRVVRSGGLVAIKEAEPSISWLEPAPPYLLQRRLQARLQFERWDPLRARTLQRSFAQAGLTERRIRSSVVERWAPLRQVEQQYYRERLAYLAGTAMELDLSEADANVWRTLLQPRAVDHLVEHPEFYMREGHVLAVGQIVG
jgi:SAM-dependent methyltransferase